MKQILLLLLAASVVLSGCASVSKDQIERDLQAKKFLATPGKSSIYIYRNERFSSGLRMALAVDGKNIGSSEPSTYFLIEVVPGQHKISCESNSTEGFILTTHPDQNYFVRQGMNTGYFSVSCAFSEVPPAEGKIAVNECELGG